jgi:hypothetical protein
MKTFSKALGLAAAGLIIPIFIAIYAHQTLPSPYAYEVYRYLAVMLVSMVAAGAFVLCVLPRIMFPFLNDAQRYGIDQYGMPKTPEYLKRNPEASPPAKDK